MGSLKIKLKSINKLTIKQRTSQIRTQILNVAEKNTSILGDKSIDEVLEEYSFMLTPSKNYTSPEPFRIGTLFVEEPNTKLAEIVLNEVIRWVQEDEGISLSRKKGGSVKTKLLTQLNYAAEIRDPKLKRSLEKLFIFNRFKYLDIEGRVTRCLINEEEEA